MENQLCNLRNQNDQLDKEYRVALNQLETFVNQEKTLYNVCEENRELQKDNTLLRHDLRESQRKLENEIESRKKGECNIQELRMKVEEEQVLRVQLSSLSQQASDKVASFDKQIRELNEMLKIETENNMKLKKTNHELSLTNATKDHNLQELSDKVTALQNTASSQAREILELQTTVEKERSLWSQATDRSNDLESRCQVLQLEIERQQELEVTSSVEIQKLNDKLIVMGKERAVLELQVKNLNNKYDQEVAAHQEDIANFTADKKRLLSSTEGANMEALQALKTRMNEENILRQKAEYASQEKERQISMLSVDYHSLQQRLQKVEGDYRQEMDKVKALTIQLEDETQKRNRIQAEMSAQLTELNLTKNRENQQMEELAELGEAKKMLHEELKQIRVASSAADFQMKELQDQLESEQYFSTLYKTQVKEQKQDIEEKERTIHDLQEGRDRLLHQLS
ncbi:rho-associated protein kinase 2-like [Tachypleus tridentatus]|uniref:rho-associated protein kinase 2-like n=1 Tax=Tachypleus tridentatus TaxID=6853 RepID=UPI003FD3EF77